jgi:hypothetical protein
VQKQYERHLLSLLACRQRGLVAPSPAPTPAPVPTANVNPNQFAGPFARRYEESPIHQSSYYEPIARGYDIESNHSRSARFAALPPPYVNYPSLNYPLCHQSSPFGAMPTMLADNSIKSSNYRTTGAIIEPQLSYLPHRVRCDDSTLAPQYQQPFESESFRRSDSVINKADVNPPTTINSIYSQQPASRHTPWLFDEKLTAPTSSSSIYQRNNVPLGNHNYNSEDSKMSDALYGKPLITSAATSPAIRMSDGDTESDAGEPCNLPTRGFRRSDLIADDTYCQPKEAVAVPEVGKQHELIDNSRSEGEPSREAANMSRVITDSASTIVGNFVIPKIVVETQIDHVESPIQSTPDARHDSTSVVDDNSALEEAPPTIYHYDKQAAADEDELATRASSHESEIKTDNSSVEGINNHDDDTTQGSAPVALNDKINEIYRKIEKIEDQYYGEKEKIIDNFERKTSSSSLADAARIEIPPMIDSSTGLKSDAAESDSPGAGEASGGESMIYEARDEHQSESAPAWNDATSPETFEPKYNFENEPIEGEISTQPYVEGDDYAQPAEFDSQYYAQQEAYANYTLDPNHQQPELQSEFDYSQPDVGSYHLQSDSNYQQGNFDEAPENPSNYTNDPTAGVYYDYDQNQQPQQSEAPQIMFDEQNYAHQEQTEYVDEQPYDEHKVEASLEAQSAENNYGFVEDAEGTSGDDGTQHNANEYQTENLEFESRVGDEMTAEDANYPPHQSELESNETFEQTTYEHEASYDRDESFATTTASTTDDSRAVEIEATTVNRDAPSQPSKSDDVKFVKQLLDSESDDATTRPNLLQTAIKEEADESDFDISSTS